MTIEMRDKVISLNEVTAQRVMGNIADECAEFWRIERVNQEISNVISDETKNI